MIKTIIIYLDEILQSPIESYGNYFYYDIAEYINIDKLSSCSTDKEILELLEEIIPNKSKFNSLLICKTQNDVKVWLDDITSYIISHINENELIYEYFNQ